ncbi:MAG: hypothetical protein HY934_09010 [Candidatus Firestonebacteria bacterium]|nr:hypothetical protein [Candidatus Firestonebacteria bacterium]
MIDEFEELEVKCFLCKKIVEKIKKDKPVTEEEQYHLSVDLPAIKVLRQNINM